MITAQEIPRTTGVYQILNLVNGKRYIGSTTQDFGARYRRHKHDLSHNKHHSTPLQRSYNKYGEKALQFTILEECASHRCLEREQFYIDNYRPEYNICKKAGSTFGVRLSEQRKEHLRQIMKGNQYCRGRTISQEIRNRISQKLKGNKIWLGKKHSEDTKLKYRQQRKGKLPTTKILKSVRCIELALSFVSVAEAVRYLRTNGNPKARDSGIIQCCKGKRNSSYKLHWEYVDNKK